MIKGNFNSDDLSRIIEMAWEDRTSFEQIRKNYGLTEKEVIQCMRRELTDKSFRLWRARVSGRKTKHEHQIEHRPTRAHASIQYKYKQNRS